MSSNKPQITPDFAFVSFVAHKDRKTALLHVSAVAKLTGTSEAYWNKLRRKGKGPRCFEALGTHWYYLADVQDWMGVVVNCEAEDAHD